VAGDDVTFAAVMFLIGVAAGLLAGEVWRFAMDMWEHGDD
jgi:hypothetical protein